MGISYQPLGMRGADRLQGEQERAIQQLDRRWNAACASTAPSRISQDALVPGYFEKFPPTFAIRAIPSGKHWRWNQTKSRTQIVHRGHTINFCKLVPRRRNAKQSDLPVPTIKSWYYEVFSPYDSTRIIYCALWCERGLREPPSASHLPNLYVTHSSLQEPPSLPSGPRSPVPSPGSDRTGECPVLTRHFPSPDVVPIPPLPPAPLAEPLMPFQGSSDSLLDDLFQFSAPWDSDWEFPAWPDTVEDLLPCLL